MSYKAEVSPKPGDLIEIFRPGYEHWAIYIGDEDVVHLVTGNDRAEVKKEPLQKVVGKDKCQINNKDDTRYSPQPVNEIITQAKAEVGTEIKQHVSSQLCEQFVTDLRYGTSVRDQVDPKPGDLIEIFRPLRQHWVIYIGDGDVVHLAPENDCAEVKKETLQKVVGKDKYQINNKYDNRYSPWPVDEIITKAKAEVGMKQSVNSQHCEKFVTELRYDIVISDQVVPKPGDLIEIFRYQCQHWAIYIGDGDVVHLMTYDSIEKCVIGSFSSCGSNGVVKKEPLLKVVGNDMYQINNKYDTRYRPGPADEIIRKAKAKVGKNTKYSLLSHNCEHFVTDLRYGVRISDQVAENVGRVAIASGSTASIASFSTVSK